MEAIFSASSMAFLLLLYQIATLAPASASAWATAKPIPAPAPETIAVRPLSENMGITRFVVSSGATVLPCLKTPPIIAGLGGVAAIALLMLKFREVFEAEFSTFEGLEDFWSRIGSAFLL